MDRPWAQVPLKRERALLFGQPLDEAVARGGASRRFIRGMSPGPSCTASS